MSSKSKKLPASLEPVPAGSVTATATAQPDPVQAPPPAPVTEQPATTATTATAVTPASPAAAPAAAAPDPVSKALSKPKPKSDPPKSSKKYLDLGAGYQISVNEGSGYYILLKVMARKSHFADVVAALEGVNPTDKAQATTILNKAMVDREVLEEAVRQDSNWDSHAQSRIKNLKMLAKSSSKAAIVTLANKDRVKGSKWVGNVREMVSTCLSSYPKSKNRNARKFEEAGVVFRQYPLKAKRGEKVFLMMFPAKYINTVRTCIETAYGVKEPRK